jgi:hypothetical protein
MSMGYPSFAVHDSAKKPRKAEGWISVSVEGKRKKE